MTRRHAPRDPHLTPHWTIGAASGLYPSILISRNLCPSTLLLYQPDGTPINAAEPGLPPSIPPELANAAREFEIDERDDDDDGIVIRHWHSVIQVGDDGSRIGVYPSVAKTLLAERKKAKKEMKAFKDGDAEYVRLDAKQAALKVICNRCDITDETLTRITKNVINHSVSCVYMAVYTACRMPCSREASTVDHLAP